MQSRIFSAICVTAFIMTGCSSTYYNAWEKVGVHKRDILVSRVENTRDAQQDAQVEFKDALEQFGSIVTIQDTNLKKAYDKLSGEYEDSLEAAEEVSERIDSVEKVANALFSEWEAEIKQYSNADFKRQSGAQLRDTRGRYAEMLRSMRASEASMKPVLQTFKDNVLFLKHNLNAQAIGSLRGEFASLRDDIGVLIEEMNKSIAESNAFIEQLQTS